jgi:hypothetical protein
MSALFPTLGNPTTATRTALCVPPPLYMLSHTHRIKRSVCWRLNIKQLKTLDGAKRDRQW